MSNKCDQEIYDKGEHFMSIFGGSFKDVELAVFFIREMSGQRVDWHPVGGVACVRAIGDMEVVKNTAELIMKSCPMKFEGWRFTTENDSPIPLSLLK